MPYSHNPKLSALWVADPAAARALVDVALSAARTVREAAEALQVSTGTLHRWMREHSITSKHTRTPFAAEAPTLPERAPLGEGKR